MGQNTRVATSASSAPFTPDAASTPPEARALLSGHAGNLAADLKVAIERVNVKGTTPEGIGFAGREEGIVAHVVCLLEGDTLDG